MDTHLLHFHVMYHRCVSPRDTIRCNSVLYWLVANLRVESSFRPECMSMSANVQVAETAFISFMNIKSVKEKNHGVGGCLNSMQVGRCSHKRVSLLLYSGRWQNWTWTCSRTMPGCHVLRPQEDWSVVYYPQRVQAGVLRVFLLSVI